MSFEQNTKGVQREEEEVVATPSGLGHSEQPQQTHVEKAESHAAQASRKATEATTAAGESAAEATLAAKEKASQAGLATAHATSQATEGTKQAAQHAADTISQYSHEVAEKAGEAGAAAKEKLTEAGEGIQSGLQSAIGFIKDHLPRVEHIEETAEEKQSKALLDEAMDRPPDHYQQKTSPAMTTTVSQSEKGTPQSSTAPFDTEVYVIEKNKPLGRSLIESAARTADSALDAPWEIEQRIMEQREEKEGRSTKGLAEVMGEKLEGAKEFVRRHHPTPNTKEHSTTVHEFSALPGDIHPPLVVKAVREHVLHRPITATTPHPPLPPPSPTPSPPEIIADAQRRAFEAIKPVEDHHGLRHSVGDTLNEAYHKVADPLSQAVHTVEEKAKWTYEHTKDELMHKSAAETHEEMVPKNAYEEDLARGSIPSSTDKVLASEGGSDVCSPSATTVMAPSTPTTRGMEVGSSEYAMQKSVEGYGEENFGSVDPVSDLSKDVSSGGVNEGGEEGGFQKMRASTFDERHPHWKEMKETVREGIQGMNIVEPGSEGEIPS